MSADSAPRPTGPQESKSFSRMEDTSPSPIPRNRAKIIHGIITQELAPADSPLVYLDPDPVDGRADLFEKRDSMDSAEVSPIDKSDPNPSQLQYMADQFELPIELVSLTDRFISSLSAKVYSTPPSIDRLSDLFQDFYVRSAAHISTHISTLASRLNRQPASSPSQPQISGKAQRNPLSDAAGHKVGQKGSEKPITNQQMLTAEEVAEKRRARKILQYKGHALEEAVERRACEAVYEKIWRHKNSLDEVRDEKLRSKTAALALVGIGLKDLGIETWDVNGEEKSEVSEFLSSARESLIKMNDEKFPLGKLQHLTAAHKAIVDTLTKVLPSSSSADEILPTLIYTLITTPAEGINIISNLSFIQRFRATTRLDGEAAYCLTNLEAAISFLENVDLNSLQTDQTQTQEETAKPPRSFSNPVSMRPDPPTTKDPATISGASPTSQMSYETGKSDPGRRPTSNEGVPKSRAADPSPQRRLTNLLQPSAKALGAANDAVRTTADQGFKNISNTLDNSFNFLFGRLREVQIKQNGEPNGMSTIVPKTLDDARRLVNTSPIIDDGNDRNLKAEDRLLGLIGGRSTSRQSSADSPGNSGSGLKIISTTGETHTPPATISGSIFSNPTNQSTPTPPFGSMKSFGNTLNPLNHIPGMIRGFGRSTPDPSQDAILSADKPKASESIPSRSSTSVPQKTNTSTNINTTELKPPIKRFLEMSDAGELKLSEIPELLEDYKRLALFLEEHKTS
ncbi:hypothetical protein EMCG_07985 [[Emmonsia] crescens]|uniref:VPS9 domain-containing protein n=1 Tax=[Emmonsia] crescens TaxID=73230 RepID=A0A0G2JAT2_9EURO|nr:hypothetical protein EMCG_07985 [Emmonsia crescens UAMH 3008]